MTIFFYSQSFCQKSAEKKSPEIIFVFWIDAWPGSQTLALRLISQHTYLVDYGDFIQIKKIQNGGSNMAVQVYKN